MLFTQLGRLVAVLAILFGAGQMFMGISISNEWLLPYEEALAKYTTRSSAGEIIDSGTYKILFGIAFGMLAEISLAIRKE